MARRQELYDDTLCRKPVFERTVRQRDLAACLAISAKPNAPLPNTASQPLPVYRSRAWKPSPGLLAALATMATPTVARVYSAACLRKHRAPDANGIGNVRNWCLNKYLRGPNSDRTAVGCQTLPSERPARRTSAADRLDCGETFCRERRIRGSYSSASYRSVRRSPPHLTCSPQQRKFRGSAQEPNAENGPGMSVTAETLMQPYSHRRGVKPRES